MSRTRSSLALLVGVLAALALLWQSTGLLPFADRGEDAPDLRLAPVTVLPPSTTLTKVPRPVLPRPGYLDQLSDPVFGSTITRIADQEGLDSSSHFLRHSSAKRQPWNSDGSRLLLGFAQPGWLLDGRTYVFRGPRLRESAGGVWSNTDPDVFYTTEGNQLLRLTVRAQGVEVLHAFEGVTELTIGNGQGSPANDDHGLVLIASNAFVTSVVNYDPLTRAVLGRLDVPTDVGRRLEWAAVSQSGDHVVLNWGPDGTAPGQGVEVLDPTLRTRRSLFPYSEASDLCVDASGREVYVTFDPTTGKLQGDQQKVVAVRLADGSTQDVLRTDWVGTDISCRNLDRPGWAYLSDGAADRPRARTGGFDEIYAVQLDGSGTVQRFAHARQSPGADFGYRSTAVPSRDGTRVLWASDWLLGPTTPAYAYVASYTGPGISTATLRAAQVPPLPGSVAATPAQQAGQRRQRYAAARAGGEEAGAVRQVHRGVDQRQGSGVSHRSAPRGPEAGDPERAHVRAQREAAGGRQRPRRDGGDGGGGDQAGRQQLRAAKG